MIKFQPLKPIESNKLVNGLVVAGAVTVVGFGVNKVYRIIRRNLAARKIDDKYVQLATRLYMAFSPSGGWLKWIDGTNYQEVKLVMSEVDNVDKLVKAYKALYGNNLLADLASELTPSQLREVNALMATKGSGSTTPLTINPNATTNKYLILKSNTNIRKTPVYIPNRTINNLLFDQNVIETVPMGRYIGYLTGNKKHWINPNSWGDPSDVWFVEFYNPSSKLKAWVAASQISQHTLKEIQSMMPDSYTISKAKYDAADSPLSGVSKVAVTTRQTSVYYPSGEVVKTIAANVVLGSILVIKNNWVFFKTAQNAIRVVDVASITTK